MESVSLFKPGNFMVEENLQAKINKTAATEEDPVLNAQRYLNIFHQIHILSAAKKAEFNDSLLKMPAKYRHILPNIPGGRILLEYIHDLEKEKGISSDDGSAEI